MDTLVIKKISESNGTQKIRQSHAEFRNSTYFCLEEREAKDVVGKYFYLMKGSILTSSLTRVCLL